MDREPIVVIVPTRGRPANAERLQARFDETSTTDTVLVFVADHDDPELPAYKRLLSDKKIDRLMIPENVPQGMCAVLNHAALRYAEMFDHVGFMGDDHLPITWGWDERILQALSSPDPRVVYGNDLLQGEALPTAVFMHSRMIKALGWMAPPELKHLYLDNFWLDLGNTLLGRVYLPDVVIEHIHPAAGKTPMDDRYRAVNAQSIDDHDRRAWTRIREGNYFMQAVDRIRKEYA